MWMAWLIVLLKPCAESTSIMFPTSLFSRLQMYAASFWRAACTWLAVLVSLLGGGWFVSPSLR